MTNNHKPFDLEEAKRGVLLTQFADAIVQRAVEEVMEDRG